MADSVEKDAYRKRVFLNYLAHPLTLAPLALGATGLLAGWALSSPAVLFGGVLAGLVGGGVFLTRLLSDDTSTEKGVISKMQEESFVARQRELDELERKLSADKDHRDEQALRDLRLLETTFKENRSWTRGIDAATEVDILLGVDRLFKHAERNLHESLEAMEQAKKASPNLQVSFLKRREQLIGEVEDGVARLRHLLEELHDMRPLSETGDDLRAIREELDTSLEIAKKAAKEVSEWDANADINLRELE